MMLSKAKALAFFVAVPLLFVAPGQSGACRSREKGDAAATQKNVNRVAREDAARETRPNVNDESGQPDATPKNANGATPKMSKTGESEGRKEVYDAVANIWGGQHIRIEMRGDGADIEYDCAHGTINSALKPDGEGRFDATGTHVREGPGPIRLGRPPVSRPARFTGRISGDEMSLTVTLTDTSQEIGTFTLTRGNEGNIRKCR